MKVDISRTHDNKRVEVKVRDSGRMFIIRAHKTDSPDSFRVTCHVKGEKNGTRHELGYITKSDAGNWALDYTHGMSFALRDSRILETRCFSLSYALKMFAMIHLAEDEDILSLSPDYNELGTTYNWRNYLPA
jgi:hypothetical protein